MGSRSSRWTILALTLLCVGTLWAGPSVSVMDTAAPPVIDGSLSDWPQAPDLVLDQTEDVVIGKANWTGPETASAKIRITYDKKNLYISADMLSKTPQYNAQEGANIYNGDALELYLGTDLTNAQRKSYEPTDVQVFISPGKNGEGAQVYSATDKAQVPGAKIATKLSAKGYTLEASIPLSFLYKLEVGPGKSIGLDIAMDDVGPVSKSRTLQLSWSRSSMGWQDPSVWGTLTFKGKTTYVNKSPKVAMPGAVSVEMDPQSGKKGASTLGMLLWGFEGGDLGGFKGKLSADSTIVSEGASSLKVDTKGSSAWNQNLAKSSPAPHAAKWKELKAITMDVYCPKGSIEPTGYTEIFMITSGPTNSWYQAMKVKLKEGWNRVRQDVDSNQWAGGIQDVYLVFNSGGPIQGEFTIDNIRGILKGAPAVLKGKVTGKTGEPVAGALVAVDRKLVKSGKDGSFKIPLPEDSYLVEVFAPGFQPLKKEVMVASTKAAVWKAVLAPEAATPKAASADVHFEKRVRSLDLHYLLGNNIADWHQPSWLSDPAALEKVRNVFTYIRVPGGGHSNIWRWKTGQVLRKDGTVQEVQAAKWSDMVGFLKAIPDHEVLLCANIMTEGVQNTLEWIADAKANGLNVKYVELGNEPDYEAELVHNGQTQYWSVIDNYSRHYIEFAKAIKAKYPELKIMGPTPSQFQNHERKEGSPWLAPETAPWWVGRFLENCGPYVDVLSIHTYPYWSNDSDANLLSKTSLWSEWIPKIRESIRKNVPDRADKVEIAVTEWNSGDENATTAKLVNAIFSAEYLAQMMVWGVNQTNIWDMYTQKPGLGGGHGVLDPNGDPDRPYAERSAYWALYMFRHFFGNTLHQAATDNEDLSLYATSAGTRKFLMAVNKSPKNAFKTAVNLGEGTKGKFKLDIHQFSSKEYQWSENLYRAVINKGPAHLKGSVPVGNRFQYTFPPYSITCLELVPVQ